MQRQESAVALRPNKTPWFVRVCVLVCERLHTRSLKAVSATVDVTWPDHGLLAAAVSSPETQIHWSEHTCSSVEEKKKKKRKENQDSFHRSVQERRARWTKLHTSYVMAYNLVCLLCTQMIFSKWDRGSALEMLALQFKAADIHCKETFHR